MLRVFLVAAMLLGSIGAQAASVEQVAKIKNIYTYGTYGSSDTRYRGDIQVIVESPISQCDAGYFVSADDATSNPALVSFLLAAFQADGSVRFAAYDDQLWDGSSAKVCRIVNIALVK